MVGSEEWRRWASIHEDNLCTPNRIGEAHLRPVVGLYRGCNGHRRLKVLGWYMFCVVIGVEFEQCGTLSTDYQ